MVYQVGTAGVRAVVPALFDPSLVVRMGRASSTVALSVLLTHFASSSTLNLNRAGLNSCWIPSSEPPLEVIACPS